MLTPFYFVKERFSVVLRYAYLKRARVLYMKPGTVSMLRIVNFNSLFYNTHTHTLISIFFIVSYMIRFVQIFSLWLFLRTCLHVTGDSPVTGLYTNKSDFIFYKNKTIEVTYKKCRWTMNAHTF